VAARLQQLCDRHLAVRDAPCHEGGVSQPVVGHRARGAQRPRLGLDVDADLCVGAGDDLLIERLRLVVRGVRAVPEVDGARRPVGPVVGTELCVAQGGQDPDHLLAHEELVDLRRLAVEAILEEVALERGRAHRVQLRSGLDGRRVHRLGRPGDQKHKADDRRRGAPRWAEAPPHFRREA
jgi:hypothetical protein